MKAKDALIAWEPADHSDRIPHRRSAPPGSIAIGPLLDHDNRDWSAPYGCTGGAAYISRGKLSGGAQQFEVLKDWYRVVYACGIHPYVAHQAFLLIDEYQTLIKNMGCGPAKDELGHDPEVGYGRSVLYPVPQIEVRRIGQSTHFWPVMAVVSTAA